MNKLKASLTVAVFSLFLAQSYANPSQKMVMSLDECLKYALERNITLEKAKLSIESNTYDEKIAKGAFLPKVSASVGQGFVNTPFSDSDPKNTYSGSYGVDLSLTIYSGGTNSLELKQSKLSTELSKLSLKSSEDELQVSITQLYVEILYAREMITVVEQSLALSEKNIERGQLQLKVGSINEADFATLQTDKATQQYNLVQAQTTLSNKYLQLKHLLEIEQNVDFQLADDSYADKAIMANIATINEVYSAAMDIRPEIASSKLSIESAKLDEKIAKAAYLPTLSLSAGLGLSHSSSSDYTFSTQAKNNYDHSIGLSLSVPIFNRFATRNTVSKTQIAVKYADLDLKDTSKDLYQTIENLHTNAQNSKALYLASEAKLEALEKSLKLTTKQFEVGLKDIIELLTQQDEFRTSSQEYLESKYTFILSQAILNYYKTGTIKL